MADQASDLGIEVRWTRQPAPVDADRDLLGVLVDNLVRNALCHNRRGGWLEVVVETDARGGAVLAVTNTGAVLDDSETARLTEPFYRPAGRVAGSHGLGLSLVAAVADSHGATLRLSSRPTGGLHVRVSFPPVRRRAAG